MISDKSIIGEQAARLRNAKDKNRPIPAIRKAISNFSRLDALAIQSENTTAWVNSGRKIVGAKIGLTSVEARSQFRAADNNFGVLYSDCSLYDGDSVAPNRLIQPKISAEIAFVLKNAPDIENLTLAGLIGAVAYALPALEITDSRIEAWDIDLLDSIADNANAGFFVLGSRPRYLDQVDLRLCGMVLEKNGEPASFGAGAASMGHPLNALGKLGRLMAEINQPLRAGDIVLSGALGPTIPLNAGDRIEARIEGLGDVRVLMGEHND